MTSQAKDRRVHTAAAELSFAVVLLVQWDRVAHTPPLPMLRLERRGTFTSTATAAAAPGTLDVQMLQAWLVVGK